MTPQPAALYAGLDQLITKPTRNSARDVTAVDVHTESEPELPIMARAPEARQTVAPTQETETPTGVSLTRRLDPEPPDSPALYRKQTLQFGARDLDAVQTLQQAMAARGREVAKNDLVRAAVEFLAKDFEAQQDDSYFVRKFVRR
jgi:hypothetical protein